MTVYPGRHELNTIGQLVDGAYPSDVLDGEALTALANAAERLDAYREWLAFELKVRVHAIRQDQQPDLFGEEVTR